MASVRARRRRRASDYYEPKPKPMGVPKLATIKLDGARAGFEAPKFTRRGMGLLLGLGGLVVAASIAGAALVGGNLFDVRAAAANGADGAAAAAGFEVADIDIRGADGARAEEVRALVQSPNDSGRSLLALDPYEIKTRIESLDWVSSVSVRRLWPNKLRIDIRRRAAFARWQEDGQVSVVDAAGERLLGERAADNAQLPLLVGEGAGPAAAPLLTTLEQLPDLRERTRALVRVGDRRWDIHLASGAAIELPERRPELALRTLERLQREHRLLDRPVRTIDMRLPGRMAVRVRPVLLGGRRPDQRDV